MWRAARQLILFTLFVVIVFVFFFYIASFRTPCDETLAYSIGTVDNRFGISDTKFKEAMQKAGTLWSEVVGKDIFVLDPHSNFSINLAYDSRQEQSLASTQIEDTIHKLEQGKGGALEQYNQLKEIYNTARIAYEQALSDYAGASNSYESSVRYWNSRGGASKSAYDSLQTERQRLAVQYDGLEKQRLMLNALADEINTLVAKNNSLAHDINNQVAIYNQTFSDEHFNQGEYLGDRINIYEFKNTNDLVYVLTHELGHALGLEHASDPKAVMYYTSGSIPSGQAIVLQQEDVNALKQLCGLAPFDPIPWYKKFHLRTEFVSFVKKIEMKIKTFTSSVVKV